MDMYLCMVYFYYALLMIKHILFKVKILPGNLLFPTLFFWSTVTASNLQLDRCVYGCYKWSRIRKCHTIPFLLNVYIRRTRLLHTSKSNVIMPYCTWLCNLTGLHVRSGHQECTPVYTQTPIHHLSPVSIPHPHTTKCQLIYYRQSTLRLQQRRQTGRP